jgi:formamidopyrimidine-DNA glycosylase
MPELPEVETVRRGLAPAMTGADITRVELRRADLRFPFPERFAARLEGARVLDLARRGKYLVAALSTGESLIMHLGMTGRFTVEGPASSRPGDFYFAAPPDAAHDHVIFELNGAGAPRRIIFNDPRRFGFMDLAPTERLAASPHFKDMGPEPLGPDFTPAALAAGLAGRAAPLKAALLDQRLVAGLGNIYVCEALHRARLSPRRRAGSVGPAQAARLHEAVCAVLEEAISAGGSTLRDFAAADGAAGAFQGDFRVYDRAGAPCPDCGRPVQRIVQSGRSTFFCSACQR